MSHKSQKNAAALLISGLTYEQATAFRDKLDANVKEATSRLYRDFPATGSGWSGLTPDEVKTPAWRAARGQVDASFSAFRAFNIAFVKKFKAEERARRRQQREAKEQK